MMRCSALIRTEQRIIKQAVARFNASTEAANSNVPAADAEPEPSIASAPLTTNGSADPEATPAATPAASEPELRSPEAEASAPGPGWVGYLTLLSSLATLGLGGFALLSVLPELRRLRRRVRELEDTGNQGPAYTETDLDAPAQEPAETRPSFLSRLRGPASGELLADNYDDDDDEPDPSHPSR
jgi:hypothetical protein